MKLKVDLHRHVPIYIQVVEWIKHRLPSDALVFASDGLFAMELFLWPKL